MLSITGMFGVAWASEHYGRILVVSLSYASSARGILLLWGLSFEASGALLVVGLLIFWCTERLLRPYRFRAGRPPVHWPRLRSGYGMVECRHRLGAGVGSLVGVTIHDGTGGYDWIFPCALLPLLIGNSMFWLIRPLGQGHW